MGALIIEADDPGRDDVRALLAAHLSFARDHTPPEDVHALDVPALLAPDISFFSARVDGELLGVGALRQLDGTHAELKSMHVAAAARRAGVGRALLRYLIAVARSRGCRRVSIETGAMPVFEPARTFYASEGFEVCEPFGEYRHSPSSVCMTLALDQTD